MPKFDTTITGNCGENYVASYLAGFGMIAALTRAGLTGLDMMVTEAASGKPMKIQVKTTRDGRGKQKGRWFYSWNTSYSVVKNQDDNLWFAYVDLNEWPEKEKLPHLFFVPSSFVAGRIQQDYKPESSPTYFSLFDDEAEEYRSIKGLGKMRAEMAANPTNKD